MDLQRLDSYQGGARPDFHEHVLHKVRISSPPPRHLPPVPISILGEGAVTSSLSSHHLALEPKEKLDRTCEPGESFMLDAVCCLKQMRVHGGGAAARGSHRQGPRSFI